MTKTTHIVQLNVQAPAQFLANLEIDENLSHEEQMALKRQARDRHIEDVFEQFKQELEKRGLADKVTISGLIEGFPMAGIATDEVTAKRLSELNSLKKDGVTANHDGPPLQR